MKKLAFIAGALALAIASPAFPFGGGYSENALLLFARTGVAEYPAIPGSPSDLACRALRKQAQGSKLVVITNAVPYADSGAAGAAYDASELAQINCLRDMGVTDMTTSPASASTFGAQLDTGKMFLGHHSMWYWAPVAMIPGTAGELNTVMITAPGDYGATTPTVKFAWPSTDTTSSCTTMPQGVAIMDQTGLNPGTVVGVQITNKGAGCTGKLPTPYFLPQVSRPAAGVSYNYVPDPAYPASYNGLNLGQMMANGQFPAICRNGDTPWLARAINADSDIPSADPLPDDSNQPDRPVGPAASNVTFWYMIDNNSVAVRAIEMAYANHLKTIGYNAVFVDRGGVAFAGKNTFNVQSTCTRDPLRAGYQGPHFNGTVVAGVTPALGDPYPLRDASNNPIPPNVVLNGTPTSGVAPSIKAVLNTSGDGGIARFDITGTNTAIWSSAPTITVDADPRGNRATGTVSLDGSGKIASIAVVQNNNRYYAADAYFGVMNAMRNLGLEIFNNYGGHPLDSSLNARVRPDPSIQKGDANAACSPSFASPPFALTCANQTDYFGAVKWIGTQFATRYDDRDRCVDATVVGCSSSTIGQLRNLAVDAAANQADVQGALSTDTSILTTYGPRAGRTVALAADIYGAPGSSDPRPIDLYDNQVASVGLPRNDAGTPAATGSNCAVGDVLQARGGVYDQRFPVKIRVDAVSGGKVTAASAIAATSTTNGTSTVFGQYYLAPSNPVMTTTLTGSCSGALFELVWDDAKPAARVSDQMRWDRAWLRYARVKMNAQPAAWQAGVDFCPTSPAGTFCGRSGPIAGDASYDYSIFNTTNTGAPQSATSSTTGCVSGKCLGYRNYALGLWVMNPSDTTLSFDLPVTDASSANPPVIPSECSASGGVYVRDFYNYANLANGGCVSRIADSLPPFSGRFYAYRTTPWTYFTRRDNFTIRNDAMVRASGFDATPAGLEVVQFGWTPGDDTFYPGVNSARLPATGGMSQNSCALKTADEIDIKRWLVIWSSRATTQGVGQASIQQPNVVYPTILRSDGKQGRTEFSTRAKAMTADKVAMAWHMGRPKFLTAAITEKVAGVGSYSATFQPTFNADGSISGGSIVGATGTPATGDGSDLQVTFTPDALGKAPTAHATRSAGIVSVVLDTNPAYSIGYGDLAAQTGQELIPWATANANADALFTQAPTLSTYTVAKVLGPAHADAIILPPCSLIGDAAATPPAPADPYQVRPEGVGLDYEVADGRSVSEATDHLLWLSGLIHATQVPLQPSGTPAPLKSFLFVDPINSKATNPYSGITPANARTIALAWDRFTLQLTADAPCGSGGDPAIEFAGNLTNCPASSIRLGGGMYDVLRGNDVSTGINNNWSIPWSHLAITVGTGGGSDVAAYSPTFASKVHTIIANNGVPTLMIWPAGGPTNADKTGPWAKAICAAAGMACP